MRGGLAGCRYRLLSIGGQIGCSDVRTYPDVRGFHYRDVLPKLLSTFKRFEQFSLNPITFQV